MASSASLLSGSHGVLCLLRPPSRCNHGPRERGISIEPSPSPSAFSCRSDDNDKGTVGHYRLCHGDGGFSPSCGWRVMSASPMEDSCSVNSYSSSPPPPPLPPARLTRCSASCGTTCRKRQMRSWSGAGGDDVAGLDQAGARTWLTGGRLHHQRPCFAMNPIFSSVAAHHHSAFASASACARGGRSNEVTRMPRSSTIITRVVGPASGNVILTEEDDDTGEVVIGSGKPSPLGVSLCSDGGGVLGRRRAVNFALFSEHASSVTLCVWDKNRRKESPPSLEIVLDPTKNRTGNVWHVSLDGIPLRGVFYGYKVDGYGGWETGLRFDKTKILLDPYAKFVEGRRIFGDRSEKTAPFLGTYDLESEAFDWGKEGNQYEKKLPMVPEKDLIIYEMNVRAFTADPSSGLDEGMRGSYLGVIEKIPHLVQLGVNCVELLPIMEYNEMEFQLKKNPRDHMTNVWGYSTLNFFAPMSRFASNGGGPVAAAREFKQMVKAFHAAGIEVVLDVVYNHTNEGDDENPHVTSFRGIDSLVYYIIDFNNYVQMVNLSGCGNTFNCNHPVVMQLILDSLKYWVQEYHVDGFRFDLASIMCRDTNGRPLDSPPLVRAIAKDPILSKCKLIAEPWDCGGLYQVGTFPNWDKWAEWNGRYRDDVRRFIKGDGGMKSAMATRLSGSADLYNVNKRKPYHSVNFVVCHDGFTLNDLVSYNEKHNDANGEEGRDGSNDNWSWNCGVEGPTNDPGVNALRAREMKNYLLALLVSQGTPMVLMGDEYAHTRSGNNNSYGHDTAMNHFLWDQLEREKERRGNLFHFTSKLIRLRRSHHLLGRENFLTKADITWHESDWHNPESRFLAFTLHEGGGGGGGGGGDLYAAFNAHSYFVNAHLPKPPHGKRWLRVVDTNLGGGEDIKLEGVPLVGEKYNLAPFSSILLRAKRV